MMKLLCTIKVQAAIASASILLGGCFLSGPKSEVARAFRNWKGGYILYASKEKFFLYVYNRNLKVVAQYPIAYGINPDRGTKLYAGDNRTPEGTYSINEILSIDADRDSPSYRKMKKINQVYFRARDGHFKYGHPRVDLGDNVYGPRYYALDFPHNRDRERYQKALDGGKIPFSGGKPYPLGGGIAIHGNNDERSIGHLASSGCLRMYNNDIIELERYIAIGTPVIISAR